MGNEGKFFVVVVVVVLYVCDARAAIDEAGCVSSQIDITVSNGAARGLGGIAVGFVGFY